MIVVDCDMLIVDFGSVLIGVQQTSNPSLGTPGAAGCLLRLDANWTLTFELFAAGTKPLLNVTVEDDAGNVVAVADLVFTAESRVSLLFIEVAGTLMHWNGLLGRWICNFG